MTGKRDIESEARVLGLRLRLGLTDLAAVERWADRTILGDDGAHAELVELCMARKVGEARAIAGLSSLGGELSALDVMQALAAVKVDAQTSDQLRLLADNLDPVLASLSFDGGPSSVLAPLRGLAGDFWQARVSGGQIEDVAAGMRTLLHAVKEHAAELPEERATSDAPSPRSRSVSAIVVSYRTGDVLFDCLQALVAEPEIAEIVLVDNGNPQDALFRVDETFGPSGKLKVIGGGVNRGFAAGVNLGVKSSTGSRLLIVNPDAVLQPGAVAALEAAWWGQAEPAVVGGKIQGTDGAEQRGARRRRLTMRSAAVTFIGMGWLKALHPGFVDVNLHAEPEPAGPVPMDAVSGAMMYMSRAGFERLGGFDEGYFLHVEDLDLCRRAEADGGSVVYTPLARALHHGGTSDAPAAAVEKHKAAGLTRYFRKFAETPAEKLAAAVLPPLIMVALLMRARLRKR